MDVVDELELAEGPAWMDAWEPEFRERPKMTPAKDWPELFKAGFVDLSAGIGSGLYVLLRKGVVLYVGQSKNMFARVGRHYKDCTFDQVLVLRCDPKQLRDLERDLILKLKPLLNLDQPGAINAQLRKAGISAMVAEKLGGTAVFLALRGNRPTFGKIERRV